MLIAGFSEMKVSVPDTLAIGSKLGPAAFYTATVSFQNGVMCMVKQAPWARILSSRSMPEPRYCS